MDNFDPGQLPFDIRSKLAELELEFSEGDVTEKGYQKKKFRLLAPYLNTDGDGLRLSANSHQSPVSSGVHIPCGAIQLPGLAGCNSACRIQLQRSVASASEDSEESTDNVISDEDTGRSLHSGNRHRLRDDPRYRSDIREEAVREALSKSHHHRLEALLPNKRCDNGRQSCVRNQTRDSDDDPSSEVSSRVGPNLAVEYRGSAPQSTVTTHDTTTGHPSLTPSDAQAPLPPSQTNYTESYDQVPFVGEPNRELFGSPQSQLDPRFCPPHCARATCLPDSDSFEQLAARAAAELGFSSPFDSSYDPAQHRQQQSLTDCDHQSSVHPTWVSPQSTQYSNSSGWSQLYSNVASDTPVSSANVRPHRMTAFGGVNVFPPVTVVGDVGQRYSNGAKSEQSDSQRPIPCANSDNPVSVGHTDMSTNDLLPSSSSQFGDIQTGLILQNRVSEKIQQLVNTLKRPKRRPLPEYYLDEDDQVLMHPIVDPSAPSAQGPTSQPIHGDELVVPSGLPRNLESALQRYAGLSCKTPMLTCLDAGGRPTQILTYAKLLHRSVRIAYTLLNKLGPRGQQSLKPRDHVALVYANNEPISFLTSFYGCILANVVPIALEIPSTRKDSSSRNMGFLLSGLNVRVVLTSEQCNKSLQRNPNGEIATYPGWPRVLWVNTDNRGSASKPPKDWVTPDRPPNEESLYSEFTFAKDGSVHAVMISRRAALAHCRALTAACDYSEEDAVVCVADCRREIGLWHAVLLSVFNGLHVIFVPYSIMQIDPGSWLRMVTKYRASVAIVKSRDMHWALLAEQDHPNVNLSSLRMLLVADGSNPWSLNSCDSFVRKFRSRGFRAETLCTAAGSSETLTLCLRRPPPSSYRSCSNGKLLTNDPQSIHLDSSLGASIAARGVISIFSLTYGVVRTDTADSLTSLMLQDCGHVLPGALAAVVRLGPKPVLCKTDELGEICLSADYTGSGYWGLRGQTCAYFNVEPLNEDGTPVHTPGTVFYTRSGFLGFSGHASSGSVIFICGSLSGLLTVAGRRHNADDIIATVLAVQPTKIVYRGRIAVFSIELLKDERIVIVAELRDGFPDEAAFSWMSLVLQAVDSIHQVSVYCLALVSQNSLPRNPLGGINYNVVKRVFSEGRLRPTALLLCPHSAIQNLPQPRQPRPSLIGPSAIMCGQVVQGARLAEARGRSIPPNTPSPNGPPSAPDSRAQLLIEILVWRATHTPDDRLFTVINQKGQESSGLTCVQLMRRASRLGYFLREKAKISVGSVVALVYEPGTEMICAFYACQFIGTIPVPVRPPRLDSHPSDGTTSSFPNPVSPPLSGSPGSASTVGIGPFSGMGHSASSSTGSWANIHARPAAQSFEASLELLWNVVKHSNASAILTQPSVIKLLKSKEATSRMPFNNWPIIFDSEENIRKKGATLPPSVFTDQPIAYLDFAAATTGTLTGIRVSHQIVQTICRTQKVQCEFYPTREVVLSLDPYSGLGFTLWTLTSIYCGHHSILVPPSISEVVPDLWLTVCSQRKVRDAFCSHYAMELATRYMTKHMGLSKPRDFSLASLRSLVVVAEERPRVQLTATFIKLFSAFGLMARAVSTSFGCRVNVAISLQGASSPETTTVYVDRISLRNDRIKLLEKGSPHSLCLMESGKLLPGVHVAIANPDTLGQCADSQLGEIWVSSLHNSEELLGPFNNASLNRTSGTAAPQQSNVASHSSNDLLRARLVAGDTERIYARTGFLGFVRRTELTQSDGELHDAIFVVGSLEESMILRGMRFHPSDIENTVMHSHRQICECAVFTWSNLLVVVAELVGEENEAMDLVHPITAHVLDEHQLIVGVVVVTDPGTVPVNSCGEKQRILLRDCFVNDKLDPIYVSYNM